MPPRTIFMEGCLNGNIEVWMGWMKTFKILLKDVVYWMISTKDFHRGSTCDIDYRKLPRAVASLTVPDGQNFHFPHFFLKFWSIYLIFPQTLLIFFLILVLQVGGSPTREGPGYATDRNPELCSVYNVGYGLTPAVAIMLVHTVHAQLCSEWHKLRYWSPV